MTTTTATTPVEVDTQLADLYWQAARPEATLASPHASDEQRAEAREHLARLQAQVAPLEAVYTKGRWNRWFWVTSSHNGHLHLGRGCSTLYPTTELGWQPELAAATPERAVELYGWHVCTVCVPTAPTLPGFRTPGTKVQEEADAAGWCLNKEPAKVDRRTYRWGDCHECGAGGVALTPHGLLRKHKHARREADAARQARISDPKLIGTPTGEVLRVDGEVLRTVRTAEIAYVDAMWWADFATRNDRPDNAERKLAEAATIAEALAAKAGTTVDEVTARLAARVERKIRQP